MIDFLNNLAVYGKNSSTMIRSQLVSHFIPWPAFLSDSHYNRVAEPAENNFITDQPFDHGNNFTSIAARTEEKQALPSLQPKSREAFSPKVVYVEPHKAINPYTEEFRPSTDSQPLTETIQLWEKTFEPQNSLKLESNILSCSSHVNKKDPSSYSTPLRIEHETYSPPDRAPQQNLANNPKTLTNIVIGSIISPSIHKDDHVSSVLTSKPCNVSSFVRPVSEMMPEKRKVSRHNITIKTAETGPTVRVNIGRIEVRALHPTAPSRSLKTQSTPLISLQDYLKQRNGG